MQRVRRPPFIHCALALCLAALTLSGCGDLARIPLAGPGLHRAVAQGGQGPLHFWWLPPTQAVPHARLLLWDGANVGLSDPAAVNQSLAPLGNGLVCNQVAPAPDGHAFVCGQSGQGASGALVQSLDALTTPAHSFRGGSGPFSWSPDSHLIAALRMQQSGGTPSCSVVALDPALDEQDPRSQQVLLSSIPFTQVSGSTASICPVQALAWSPDGTRLALSLALGSGVAIEVLRLGANQQLPLVETRTLVSGAALQLLDMPAVPSLFWSPDGQMLAALTGYRRAIEDSLFLLTAGQPDPLAGPNVIDTGAGAALAFSPDSRFLAVGAVGSGGSSDNALLRIYDRDQSSWRGIAPMLVNGPTLAWSADGTSLAAASAARQGVALWNWPAGTPGQVVPNRDIANLEQLGWAQDGSTLFFSVGAQGVQPAFEELYTQALPIPVGTGEPPLPNWFADLLAHLSLGLLWLAGGLLLLIIALGLLALTERGRSRRRRALILWSLGVSTVFFCAILGVLLFGYQQLPQWTAWLYQPYSQRLCRGSTAVPCNAAATLVVATLGGILALGLLVIALGTLIGGRRRRAIPGEGLPRPVRRPFFGWPFVLREPLLLPPPASRKVDEDAEAGAALRRYFSPREREEDEGTERS